MHMSLYGTKRRFKDVAPMSAPGAQSGNVANRTKSTLLTQSRLRRDLNSAAQQSPVCYSFRSEARAASGSETARVQHLARRGGGVAARGAGAAGRAAAAHRRARGRHCE